jgi:hypothetical protein
MVKQNGILCVDLCYSVGSGLVSYRSHTLPTGWRAGKSLLKIAL